MILIDFIISLLEYQARCLSARQEASDERAKPMSPDDCPSAFDIDCSHLQSTIDDYTTVLTYLTLTLNQLEAHHPAEYAEAQRLVSTEAE